MQLKESPGDTGARGALNTHLQPPPLILQIWTFRYQPVTGHGHVSQLQCLERIQASESLSVSLHRRTLLPFSTLEMGNFVSK